VNHTIPVSKSQRLQRAALICLAVLLAVNALVVGVTYLLYPGYVDTGEPNIVALAWRLLDGHAVYVPIDDETRITNLYGPYLYLIHAFALWAFGGLVAVGKAPGVLAMAVAIFATFWAARKLGVRAAALAVAGLAVIIILNLPMTVWDRPEAFMLMATALALTLMPTNAGTSGVAVRVFGLGCLIGFAMGLKVFAAVYFLPFGLLLLANDGFKAAVVSVLVAVTIVTVPFLTPYFDFTDMVGLIEVMSRKPDGDTSLSKLFRYAAYLLVPALVLIGIGWRHMDAATRRNVLILEIATAVGIVLVFYPAQKPGAGYYYLVPFAPLSFVLAAMGLKAALSASNATSGWVAIALIVLLALPAVPIEKRFFRNLDWQTANGVADEINAINQAYAGRTIEIGIGHGYDSYRTTYQRTRLVFAGHPYTLDTSIVIDTTAWGVMLNDATLAMMARCNTDIWLIPTGERPYDWLGYYGVDVYGQAFRDTFHSAYEKIESRTYFDIYGCRSLGGS